MQGYRARTGSVGCVVYFWARLPKAFEVDEYDLAGRLNVDDGEADQLPKMKVCVVVGK